MTTKRSTQPYPCPTCGNRAAHRQDMSTLTALNPSEAVGDRLLGVDELAAVMGVQVSTIHDWRYRGRTDRTPPAIKLGSSLRWRASDVRRFLDELVAS